MDQSKQYILHIVSVDVPIWAPIETTHPLTRGWRIELLKGWAVKEAGPYGKHLRDALTRGEVLTYAKRVAKTVFRRGHEALIVVHKRNGQVHREYPYRQPARDR